MDIELTVKHGRGYVPAERNKEEGLPIGVIAIDSIFSPIKRVNFHVENARVGRMTDYDKLTLEIWTDGTISPREALSTAAGILRDHVNIFINAEERIEGRASSGATTPNVKSISICSAVSTSWSYRFVPRTV